MNIKDAISYVKSKDKAKFDSSIEVHINCLLNKDKQESLRFSVTLPHGVGKNVKVAVMSSKKVKNASLELSEADIDAILEGRIKPKVDFDILIAEPQYMTKLAKVAKILGPAGAMPNPKNGTVTENVEKALEEFKKGRIEVKTEPHGSSIHTIIGKKSFTDTALEENFLELMSALKSNKPAKAPENWIKSIYLSSTMGPSVLVEL